MAESSYQYAYPRPALTVDSLVFNYHEGILNLLLIKRGDAPYKDCWAFPGGFVNEGETVEEAMVRELIEETGLHLVRLEQVYTASTPGRDPRGWTVSVIFIGIVATGQPVLTAGDDAAEAAWHPMTALPELAFDHNDIVSVVKTIMRNRIVSSDFLKGFLPDRFSINQLYSLLKHFFPGEKEIENVKKKLLAAEIILPAGQTGLLNFR